MPSESLVASVNEVSPLSVGATLCATIPMMSCLNCSKSHLHRITSTFHNFTGIFQKLPGASPTTIFPIISSENTRHQIAVIKIIERHWNSSYGAVPRTHKRYGVGHIAHTARITNDIIIITEKAKRNWQKRKFSAGGI